MTQPLLLLDVDGVLCPFGEHTYAAHREMEMIRCRDNWVVQARPRVRHHLATLREHYELVWATMWEESANTYLLDFFGLDPLPVIEFAKGMWPPANGSYDLKINDYIAKATTQTYKLPAIEAFVGERPFVWVDDHLLEDAWVWAEHRNNVLGIPTLFICPDPTVGLTSLHVGQMLDFAHIVSDLQAP